MNPKPSQGAPPDTSNNGPSVIEKVLGSSDSNASDQDDSEEQINQIIQKKVLMYFGEHPLPKKENTLAWWKTKEA